MDKCRTRYINITLNPQCPVWESVTLEASIPHRDYWDVGVIVFQFLDNTEYSDKKRRDDVGPHLIVTDTFNNRKVEQ